MAYLSVTGTNKCKKNHTLPCLTVLLTVSTILSILAITPLENEDRISLYRGGYLFFLGLIFFTVLFQFVNHVALKTPSGLRFKKKYHLSVSDILDISNKLVSSVQALLSCLTGIVVCTYSCTRDFLHTSHFVSEAYAWFGASYFFYDIWSMYKVHTCVEPAPAAHIYASKSEIIKQKLTENKGESSKSNNKNGSLNQLQTQQNQQQLNQNQQQQLQLQNRSEFIKFGSYIKTHPVILMHHLFIGSFGFLVIVYLRGGLGDCVFGYVYLMELSTPFVSLRGVISRLGMKNTNWYVLNGLVMLGTFFLCRVVMFPYVIYLYSEVVSLPYIDAIHSLPRGCKIGILILLLPQFYWFFLMVKGATKVFCGPQQKQASSSTIVQDSINNKQEKTKKQRKSASASASASASTTSTINNHNNTS